MIIDWLTLCLINRIVNLYWKFMNTTIPIGFADLPLSLYSISKRYLSYLSNLHEYPIFWLCNKQAAKFLCPAWILLLHNQNIYYHTMKLFFIYTTGKWCEFMEIHGRLQRRMAYARIRKINKKDDQEKDGRCIWLWGNLLWYNFCLLPGLYVCLFNTHDLLVAD